MPKPLKAVRIENEETEFESDDDTTTSPFVFDTVPTEVLDNFVRFCIDIPRAKNWETHLPLGNCVRIAMN